MNYYEKAKAIISELRKKAGYDLRWDLQISYPLDKEAADLYIYFLDTQVMVTDFMFDFYSVDEIVTDLLRQWKS